MVLDKNSSLNIFTVWFDKFFYRKSQKTLRRKIISVTLFIVVGFLLSFFILIGVGLRPSSFFAIFTNIFISRSNTQSFLYQISIFIMAALAFSFSMNVGIFNIGISGQMMAGASTAILLISVFPEQWKSISDGGQIVTLLFSIISSVFVSVLTGVLKIYFKVNEVVTAILLNWIILFIVAYLVQNYDFNVYQSVNGGYLQTNKVPDGFAFYQSGAGMKPSFLTGSGWVWSIAVTVVAVVVVWFLMKFTVFGHKLKTTGISPFASQYFGYNKNGLQLASFAISGVLSGILGVIVYTGQSNYLNFNSLGNTALNSVPIEGFNGIAIGLISLNNPIAIVIVSILLSFVYVGASPANLPSSSVFLVTGILMYMIAIYAVLAYLKPWRWIYLLRYKKVNSNNYFDFENAMASNSEAYKFKVLFSKNEIVKNLINDKVKIKNEKLKNLLIFLVFNPYFKISLIFSKKYFYIKNQIVKDYIQERKKIVSKFKLLCATNLIVDWQDKVSDILVNKKSGIIGVSHWNKQKLTILKWMKFNADQQTTDQANKQILLIDQKLFEYKNQMQGKR